MKITVEIDGQKYEVNIEDLNTRPIIAMIEDVRYEVWPESEGTEPQPTAHRPSVPRSEPVQTASATVKPTQQADTRVVASPLPGVIVAILVKPGDQVTRGQELCTLEAMKMKNAIRSTRDGKLASVDVSVGDQVGHGKVLMTYTD